MKTLKKHINESIFILESNDGWLNDFINEIKNTNTNGKLQEFFPLYGVDIQRDYNREAISRYSWTPETDDTILKRINNVVVTNFLTIYVVTMKKGNYYGIPKDWRTHMPKYTKLLPLFNKRVKGTKGMLFTDDVDNIKKYISTCTTNYLIDVPLTDEYYYGKYIYTSKENAA